MNKNIGLFSFFLIVIFQNYACEHQVTPPEETKKVFVSKRTVNVRREKPTPIVEVEEFKASCTSSVGGCEKIQSLKQKITDSDEFFLTRASVLKNDLNHLIEVLNKAEYVYPQFSVDLRWKEDPLYWQSISGDKEANVLIKTKYLSWENSFYPKDTDLIKKAYVQFENDLKYFAKELDSLKRQPGFSLKNLSDSIIPLAEDVNFSIVNNKITAVFPIPKQVVEAFDFPPPHINILKVAIVNSEYDLNYHIVEEKNLSINIQPFELNASMLMFKNALIEKKSISFSVPTHAICKSLRAEIRMEKANEDIKKVMKIIKDPYGTLKNEEKIRFVSTQPTDKLSVLEEEAKMLKEKNIMLEVAKIVTEPNTSLSANLIKKDGSFEGWDFPPKNISPSDFQIISLFRELKPQAPLEKKLCIHIDNKPAFTIQTSESSLPMIIDVLDLPQNILIPEESLSVSWNEKNMKNNIVGEKSDFGYALFDVLKKKKEVTLKLNKTLTSVPYMIHLQTDTGAKINLPVEVDGLKTKRELSPDTKWRLMGIAEQFPILDTIYHKKLLSNVIDEGSIKLFDIQYERSFPEYISNWKKIRKYEVHLNGDRDNFLGITTVTQYFRQVVKHTEGCHVDISLEFKSVRDEEINQKAKENSTLVKKSILHIPDPNNQYILGYIDPPICQ